MIFIWFSYVFLEFLKNHGRRLPAIIWFSYDLVHSFLYDFHMIFIWSHAQRRTLGAANRGRRGQDGCVFNYMMNCSEKSSTWLRICRIARNNLRRDCIYDELLGKIGGVIANMIKYMIICSSKSGVHDFRKHHFVFFMCFLCVLLFFPKTPKPRDPGSTILQT